MRKSTLQSLCDSIFSGLDQWLTDPTLSDYLVPTAGLLLPQLQCITKAFQAQSSIGWGGLFMGHVATYWTDAYSHTYETPSGKKHPTPSTISKLTKQWSNQLITQLWKFSKSVWAYRNAVVHGQTEHLKVSKERLQMQAEVCLHFAAYQDNPHYIPQNRTSLFDRGEEATLALRRDAMVSWLALVEEVVLTHQQRQTANTTKITQFFIRRVPMTDIRVEADILRAPFSAEYYRRKMPNQWNKAQAGQPTNPKPPRPKRRANSRKEHLQQPSTTSIMAFSSGE
jgi:hypothetical protein